MSHSSSGRKPGFHSGNTGSIPVCDTINYIYKARKIKERVHNKGLTNLELQTKIKSRKVERPSYKILIEEVNNLGYSAVGRKYGVSDNAIRK